MTQFSLNDIRPVDETCLSEKELSIKKEKDEIAKLLDRQENGFIIEKMVEEFGLSNPRYLQVLD